MTEELKTKSQMILRIAELSEQNTILDNENKKTKEIIEKFFGDDVNFCKKCCAKGKCNGSCCYEQIKEMFEDLK